MNAIYDEMNSYDDIYILMDRLTFNKTIAINKCLDEDVMKEIFNKLLLGNNVFNYTRFIYFNEMLSKLVMIRNYVYHNKNNQ